MRTALRFSTGRSGGKVNSFGGAAMLSSVIAGKLPDTKRFVVSSPALKVKVVVPQWKMNLGEMASRVMRVAPSGRRRSPWQCLR